jgi:hypothetical protein
VKFEDKGAALERFFQRLYADAPPDNSGTTNILNVNISAFTDGLPRMTVSKIAKDTLRRSLAGQLPG